MTGERTENNHACDASLYGDALVKQNARSCTGRLDNYVIYFYREFHIFFIAHLRLENVRRWEAVHQL